MRFRDCRRFGGDRLHGSRRFDPPVRLLRQGVCAARAGLRPSRPPARNEPNWGRRRETNPIPIVANRTVLQQRLHQSLWNPSVRRVLVPPCSKGGWGGSDPSHAPAPPLPPLGTGGDQENHPTSESPWPSPGALGALAVDLRSSITPIEARLSGRVVFRERGAGHDDPRARAYPVDSRRRHRLAALGPVRQRPRLGDRPRGLQRRRRRLGLPAPRPGPQQGLPLGRGRHRRHLRPLPAPRASPPPSGTAATRSSRNGSSA